MFPTRGLFSTVHRLKVTKYIFFHSLYANNSRVVLKKSSLSKLLQYLGKWYEIASYPQPFQFGDCARAQYSLGDNVVDVVNTQVVNKTLDVMLATAVVASTDGSGVLNVTFNLPGGG